MREGAVHCSLPLKFLCRSHAYVVPSSPSFPINSGRCILPSFDPCSGPGGTHKLERRMLGWLIGMELAVRRPGSRGTSDADGARQVLRPLRVLVPAEGQASIASFSSHSVASSSAPVPPRRPAAHCSSFPHRTVVLSSLHAPHVQPSPNLLRWRTSPASTPCSATY